jgi:O-antigen/teichoic acid export membrane protein
MQQGGTNLKWFDWTRKGSLALLDQAFLSGANFAFSILLARSLGAADYGAYAVAFAIFLFLANLYQAVLLTPSIVVVPGCYSDRRAEYFGAALRVHGVISVLLGACLAGGAAVAFGWFGDARLGSSLGGLALALPWVLLCWLGRNHCYLTLSSGPAAMGSLLYGLLLLSGVAMLHAVGRLTVFSGFLAMTLAGLVAGVFLVGRSKIRFGEPGPRAVWRESWVLGRWELAISIAKCLPIFGCYPLTAAMLGTEATGGLRALNNLTMPMTLAFAAISRLAVPYFTAAWVRLEGGIDVPSLRRLTAAAMALSGAYLVVLTVLRRPVMHAVYGGRYDEFAALVPWMVLCTVFASGSDTLSTALRARRSPALVFAAYAVSGLGYLIAAPVLTRAYGLPGVVASLILNDLLTLAAAAWRVRRCAEGARKELRLA